jgi:phosphohistidine swiveling domain-containing protein
LASSTLRLLAQFVDLQDARKYAVFVTNALLLAAFKRVLDRRGFDAPDQEAIIQHAFPWWIVEKDPAGLLNDVSVAQTGALKVAYQQECIGASASEHFDALQRPKDTVTKIVGFGASRGTMRGPIRVINGTKDFPKVQTGDIIVTSMTRPEMIPVMRLAAAFVTDEGGVTCHAAIVAREMKKPCIIGTKIATQVLKDGDMVEVDAERGIVQILK